MYTDPHHLKVSDPGTVEGHAVFALLDAFDTDKVKLKELKAHYRAGGLGDGVVKQRLLAILEELLAPIRARRAEYEADPGEVMRIISSGSEVARGIAAETLKKTRTAMHLM
jgi:tryptophanyl-tRNA synthetase